MGKVTGYTAVRMKQIEDSSIVGAIINAGHLILSRHDTTTIDVGNVIGPKGDTGAKGADGSAGPVAPSGRLYFTTSSGNLPIGSYSIIPCTSDAAVLKGGMTANGANGSLTVPQDGEYHYDINLTVSAVPGTSGYNVSLLVNGVQKRATTQVLDSYTSTASLSGLIDLKTGDVLTWKVDVWLGTISIVGGVSSGSEFNLALPGSQGPKGDTGAPGPIIPGQVLSRLDYNPSSNTTYTLSSTAQVQVDTGGNLSMPAFNVPPSGTIEWYIECLIASGTSNLNILCRPWTPTQGFLYPYQKIWDQYAAFAKRVPMTFTITGLTPGSLIQNLQPTYSIDAGSAAAHIFAGASQGSILQVVRAV